MRWVKSPILAIRRCFAELLHKLLELFALLELQTMGMKIVFVTRWRNLHIQLPLQPSIVNRNFRL